MKKLLLSLVFSFMIITNLHSEIIKLTCTDKTERDLTVQISKILPMAQIQGQIVELIASDDQYTLQHFSNENGVRNHIFFQINRSTGRFSGIWHIADIEGYYDGFCRLKKENKF